MNQETQSLMNTDTFLIPRLGSIPMFDRKEALIGQFLHKPYHRRLSER